MTESGLPPDWLRQYGNSHEYTWRRTRIAGQNAFCRPLGLVEFSFDADGRYFEGRADMSCLMGVHIKSTLSNEAFRERVLLAWTRLRCQHLLLRARTMRDDRFLEINSFAPLGLYFVVDMAESVKEAREDAGKHLVFLKDCYDEVDVKDFCTHCQNVRRVIDPQTALAKVFVLPVVEEDGKKILRLLFVGSHQVWDGLSSYVWMRDFVEALNESQLELHNGINESIRTEIMEQHLPLPQEALYPAIPGSKARQRWFWAITRILRHVRTPLPVGFENPLRRRSPRTEATPLSPVYNAVLDYSKTPVINTFPVSVLISAASTQRLHRLAKEAKASMGAGIYALSALVMMEFYEEQYPQVRLEDRGAFIAGFPLNPRAFFNHHNDPDSMMLAFSDGISLPFLSSDLPLEGRVRLLARQAQRQLATYQKRAKPKGHDTKLQYLNSRGAGLVLANQYLYSLERVDSCLPEHLREGVNMQGAYPARKNPTMQTCGVSSVGNRDALIRSGIFDLNDPSKDFAADFLDMKSSVRPREFEFLVGIGGSSNGLFCTPSIDANKMDPVLVERWRHRLETALDEVTEPNNSSDSSEKARL